MCQGLGRRGDPHRGSMPGAELDLDWIDRPAGKPSVGADRVATAKRANIHVGRKPSLDETQTTEARALLAAGRPAREVAALWKTSERSLYRALRRHVDEP